MSWSKRGRRGPDGLRLLPVAQRDLEPALAGGEDVVQGRFTRLKIEGYCSLKHVELELGPVTVLIGPNGAGKSNLLSALRLMPCIQSDALHRFTKEAGGAAALMHYGPKQTPSIDLEFDFAGPGRVAMYHAKLARSADDSLYLEEEEVRLSVDGAPARPITVSTSSVSVQIAQMGFFHFHDTSRNSALRSPARVEDTRTLKADGSNLAAYLLMLKESDERADQKSWRRIARLMRRITPSIKALEPTRISGERVRLDWLDDRDEIFGVQYLSDGSLRAIALVTALSQPAKRMPRFISIDEPELGLHPVAISLIAGLVHSVSHRCQVVLATQSIDLLDYFEPSAVVIAERHDNASTLRRLDASTLATWLERYTLSELYAKNLLGGRA